MKLGLPSNFAFVKSFTILSTLKVFLSLASGWAANSLSLCLGSFVYFYLNSALQILYRRRRGGMDNKDLSYLAHIVVASISGMINVLVTTPLWVATTRLTMQGTTTDRNNLGLKPHAIHAKKRVGSLTAFFHLPIGMEIQRSKRVRKITAILIDNQTRVSNNCPQRPV